MTLFPIVCWMATLAQAAEPSLIWKSAPPRWAAFLLVLGAIAFIVAVYRGEGGRTMSPLVRWTLGAIRLAILIAVFLVFCDPVYESKVDRTRKSALVVLVDESLSMTLEDKYTIQQIAAIQTRPEGADEGAGADGEGSGSDAPRLVPLKGKSARIAVVNRLLDRRGGDLVRQLRQRSGSDVELYSFSSQLYPNIQAGKTVPRGQQTRIGDSLAELLDQPRDRRITGVVILTDGQSNSDETKLEDVIPRLAEKKIPVYCIGVGSPIKHEDIELRQLRVRQKVLAKDKVTFGVRLAHQGYANKTVQLRLEDITRFVKTVGTGWRKRRDPKQKIPLVLPAHRVKTLKIQPVKLGADGVEMPLSLVHIFDKEGVYFIRAIIPLVKDEEHKNNNQIIVRVEVRDDRLRVLYVDGFPRYEYRSLKNWLVRDPKIIANVVLCSADPEFPQDKSPAAPEIERFPISKEELFKYHVVILGDVNPRQVGVEGSAKPADSRRFLKHVAEFVEKKGGGLIMIAGSEHNPRSYEDGPLQRALPVRFVNDRWHAKRTFTEAKRFKRTPLGQGHPVFRIDDDPNTSRKMWEQEYVGKFMWYQRVKPVPGASVLAVHPDEDYRLPGGDAGNEEKRNYPIFCLRNYGLGKVFFTATDETWRWRFLVGDLYFARFWAQVIRYVGSPALFGDGSHFKLYTDRRTYEPLDRVKITLEVLDREYKPLEQKNWKLRFRSPSGKEGALFLQHVKRNQGTYTGVLHANQLGRWDIWVDKDKRRGFEEARRHFDVRIPDIESRRPELNEEVLKEIADRTDGEYFRPWEAQELPAKIRRQQKKKITKLAQSRSAWDQDWVLALILCLLCGEWLIRKLNRLQ